MTDSIDLIKESISQWADDEEISLTDGQISYLALLKWKSQIHAEMMGMEL